MLDLSKTTSALAAPDFAAIKKRQQATWSAGDYAVVGTNGADAAVSMKTNVPKSRSSS